MTIPGFKGFNPDDDEELARYTRPGGNPENPELKVITCDLGDGRLMEWSMGIDSRWVVYLDVSKFAEPLHHMGVIVELLHGIGDIAMALDAHERGETP